MRLDKCAHVAPSNNFYYNFKGHEAPPRGERGLAILALRKLNRHPYFVSLIYSATFSPIMLHIKILFKGYLTVSQTFSPTLYSTTFSAL